MLIFEAMDSSVESFGVPGNGSVSMLISAR